MCRRPISDRRTPAGLQAPAATPLCKGLNARCSSQSRLYSDHIMTIRIFCKGIVIAIIVCASVIGWKAAVALQRESRETAVNWQEKKYGGLSVSSLAIG